MTISLYLSFKEEMFILLNRFRKNKTFFFFSASYTYIFNVNKLNELKIEKKKKSSNICYNARVYVFL
jgi:hypothetical protein